MNERASDIRKLVDLRLRGHGQSKIAKTLNAEGIPPADSSRWTSRKVGTYVHEHGLNLLQGHYTFGVELEEGHPDRVFVPNMFPAVITEQEAEQILSQNRKLIELYGDGGPRKAVNTTYVLSGVFRCAACGAPMHSRNASPKDAADRATYECRRSKEDTSPHPSGSYVSGDMSEDAVMRVMLAAARDYEHQFENPPPMETGQSNNGSAIDKQIQKITERISRLMDGFTDGVLKREDFQPRYDALVAERERLQASFRETDSVATIRFVMKDALEAASGPKFTVEQARRLVLAFVKKVEGPVDVDPKRIGLPKAKRGRALWITLNVPLDDGPTRILAPMYEPGSRARGCC